MNRVIEIIKENKFLIAVLIVLIAVFTGIAIYKNQKNAETENGRNPENENQISEEYEKRELKANEYIVMHVAKIDVIKDYFKDYIIASVNNPEEAYELLSEESKKEYTLEEYKAYLKRNNTINTKNSVVEKYRSNKEHKKYGYEILDSEENRFLIVENSIWDYEITLLEKIS